ncbi:MAG TPA: hypothetical protein PKN75_06905 [Bacteroidia bacterium]|nr:hypothetical protein [Bacteroidia bacterium]HNU33306.1 hypothetical protein [Bacteroidia bacterium]
MINQLQSNRFVTTLFKDLNRLRYVALLMTDSPAKFIGNDLTILLDSKQYSRLLEIIGSSENVKSVTLLEKPFSADITINFYDHSSLHLVVITAFVRKGLKYMDEQKVLSTLVINDHGIKVPQSGYNFEYVILQHLLNGVNVGEKYREHFSAYSREERSKIFLHMRGKYAFEINVLDDLYCFEEKTYSTIRKRLNKLKSNSLLRRLIRDVFYLPYFFINLYNSHRIKISFKPQHHAPMKSASSAA